MEQYPPKKTWKQTANEGYSYTIRRDEVSSYMFEIWIFETNSLFKFE